jgi:cytochrome c oxidase subunit II
MAGAGRSSHISFLTVLIIVMVTALAGTATAHAAGSAHPEEWNRLLWIVLGLGIAVGVFVFALMAVAIWRYRENSPYIRKEPSTHNFKLEVVWTIIPVILVTVVIVLSLGVLSTTEDIPNEGLHIDVIGRQFEWEFIYPDNTTSIDEVWVEDGQTVIFTIWSEDVIHSFFMPDFKLKVDAFPNYKDTVYIVATPPGEYQIVCAEFCGDIHSEMLGTLHVFKKGLSDKPYGPPPGEAPPPPVVEVAIFDVELREDGGPNATVPWSIDPSIIEVNETAEVTLRVWNNGTQTHGFSLQPPYNRTITEIPPGEFRYLNFTAEHPTRGVQAFCPDDDHRTKGMNTTLVVNPERVEAGVGTEEAEISPRYLYGGALALLGVVMVTAIWRKPRDEEADDQPDMDVAKDEGKDVSKVEPNDKAEADGKKEDEAEGGERG